MEIFESWLLDFNKQMKTQDKKVLLLVDNAGGHNITPELIKRLTHVEVYFLPPNTTSVIQPCDQGIIRSFKEAWGKVSKETIANCWKHAGKQLGIKFIFISSASAIYSLCN